MVWACGVIVRVCSSSVGLKCTKATTWLWLMECCGFLEGLVGWNVVNWVGLLDWNVRWRQMGVCWRWLGKVWTHGLVGN